MRRERSLISRSVKRRKTHVFIGLPPQLEADVRVDKQGMRRNLTADFDSGDSTFLQRGSPPPPPWRLLPESFLFDGFPVDAERRFSYFACPLAGV